VRLLQLRDLLDLTGTIVLAEMRFGESSDVPSFLFPLLLSSLPLSSHCPL